MTQFEVRPKEEEFTVYKGNKWRNELKEMVGAFQTRLFCIETIG